MHADARKFVWDARQAIGLVLDFAHGKTFSDYQADLLLRSAVERQLEITGEALSRLRRIDAQTAAAIGDLPRVIGFRNVLVHGYATVDDRLVWGVIENHASSLRDALDLLLESSS